MKFNEKFNIFDIPKNIEQSNKIKKYNQSNNDRKFFNFTIGQSPFPIPKHISKSLSFNSDKGEYSPPLGISGLNESIAKFYNRYHSVDIDPNSIFSGLGTKNILFILTGLIQGTYFLPVPAWGGYEPFLKYYDRKIEKIYLKPKSNYQFEIQELDARFKKTKGQKVFIFNSPHNPSGKVFNHKEMEELSIIFKKHNVIVISDEIYALTTYDFQKYLSFYNYYPKKTFLLGGISKDRGAAGYRFGVCVLPVEETDILKELIKRAISNFYISLPTPIQLAAKEAYSISERLDEYLKKTRNIYHKICQIIIGELEPIRKLDYYIPEAGFYITIDLNGFKEELNYLGIHDSDDLLELLFNDPYNVALVPGTTMGLQEKDFTFRIAFVDFDGEKLLENYDAYVEQELVHMINGIKTLKQFLVNLGNQNE